MGVEQVFSAYLWELMGVAWELNREIRHFLNFSAVSLAIRK